MIKSLFKAIIVALVVVVLLAWAVEASRSGERPAAGVAAHLRGAWNTVAARGALARLKTGDRPVETAGQGRRTPKVDPPAASAGDMTASGSDLSD